jgi:hypothetical protein
MAAALGEQPSEREQEEERQEQNMAARQNKHGNSQD